MMMNEPSPSIPNPHISDVGSASRSSLAPGFRFHPTDEELVSYYLKRKVKGLSLRVDAIAELDLYKKEPWELPHYSRLRSRDKEWYFFSPLDRKYSNRSRTNRATAAGYWKTTGKDRPVKHLAKTVGMKKTLVFHAGRAPKGKRTNWVMHEYRMGDEDEQQQQMNNPNVLQASFVVCRIFEKNGTGPQNGAQYGAPFLEEEWEEDGVPVGVLMDNAYSGGEQGSVHPDEFEQKHIVGDQHESTATVVAESERKDIGSLSEDSAIFLEDILDLDRFDSEPGLQNSPNNINKINLEEHSEIGLLSHSPSGRNDAYMELKDIVDNINMDRPLSGFDGVLLGVGNDRTLALDNSANETAVLPEVDSTEFNFDIANETTIDQELSKLCSPTYGIFDLQSDNFLNNYVVGDYQSGQLYEDSNVFYDAPSSDPPFAAAHNFTNSSNSQFSPGADLRGFDMVDELVTYFDAPDNDLLYDNWDSSLKSEFVPEVDDNFHSTWEADLKVPQTYTENNASSSSRFVEANHQFESKNEDDTVAPGAGANKSWNKSITNRVVDMLGSISAPPAMAEGSMKGKGVLGLVSASQSSSSIHVSAGMIQIHGSTVMGSAEHWTLQKNRDTSFLVSYGMSSDNDGFTKMHGGIFGMLLRGGFYLFGISALLLSVSYKVVMCGYSK